MNRYKIHDFFRQKIFTDFNVGDRVKYSAKAASHITETSDIDFVPPIEHWRGHITHKLGGVNNLCVVRWDHLVKNTPYDSTIIELDLAHE